MKYVHKPYYELEEVAKELGYVSAASLCCMLRQAGVQIKRDRLLSMSADKPYARCMTAEQRNGLLQLRAGKYGQNWTRKEQRAVRDLFYGAATPEKESPADNRVPVAPPPERAVNNASIVRGVARTDRRKLSVEQLTDAALLLIRSGNPELEPVAMWLIEEARGMV